MMYPPWSGWLWRSLNHTSWRLPLASSRVASRTSWVSCGAMKLGKWERNRVLRPNANMLCRPKSGGSSGVASPLGWPVGCIGTSSVGMRAQAVAVAASALAAAADLGVVLVACYGRRSGREPSVLGARGRFGQPGGDLLQELGQVAVGVPELRAGRVDLAVDLPP